MLANVSHAVLNRMIVRVFLVFILLSLAAPTANTFAQTGRSQISLLGLQLSETTDELRRKYRIAPGISGIVIIGVDPARNAASEFGGEFVAGEVITAASVYLLGIRHLSRPEDLLSVIEQNRREYRNSLAVWVANTEGQQTMRHLPIANYEPSKVLKKNAEQQMKTARAGTSCADRACKDAYSDCVKKLKEGETDFACKNKTLECRARCRGNADSQAFTTGSLQKANPPRDLSPSNAAPAGQERGSTGPGPGWFDTNKSNCKVWNSVPQITESATWSGGCSSGRANGQGRLVWKYVEDGVSSSQAYEGHLKDGRLHGQGVFTYADGDRYEGEFKDSKRHGPGVFTYADGDRYEGQWKDGDRHGRGVYTYADGDRVEGEFKDGEATGRAKFTRRRSPTEIIYFKNGCGETKKYRICLQ